MKLVIDTTQLAKNNITIGEVFCVLEAYYDVNHEQCMQSSLNKGLIGTRLFDIGNSHYYVSKKGVDTINNLINDSTPLSWNENTSELEQRIDELVPKLQEIYPTGKNFNGQYWRGNKTDIKRKLKSFFKKYGSKYTDTQIIKATEDYVNSFNGNYKYMRLLQYFIWKEEVKDGTKVLISELATCIENEGQVDNEDWTAELR